MVVFACQRDSFLNEFSTTVVSCAPAELKSTTNGKKETLKGFDVILEDTIIFPEGGGQPSDYGYLNDVRTEYVRRVGSEAVHFTTESLQPGSTVRLRIDWERRLDHMQQHSGKYSVAKQARRGGLWMLKHPPERGNLLIASQHLITALADAEFGYATTSWWLGEDISHIELDTQKITEDEIKKLEILVNEKILQGLPVSVQVYNSDDPTLTETRTRGLPKDHVGDVRIVTIENVESNMCCGTHVTNLSQLQVIKLVGAEKGKKGKTNLLFLVGNRVLKRMSAMLEKEQALTAILNNSPDIHVDLVDKLMKSVKLSNKNLQTALRDLAILEVKILKEKDPRPPFYALHRKEAEMDFINVFIKEVNDTKTLLVLSIGDEKGAGHVVLYGEESLVAEIGPRVAVLLEGKGNGKGSRFQAKVTNLANRDKVIQLLKEKLGS